MHRIFWGLSGVGKRGWQEALEILGCGPYEPEIVVCLCCDCGGVGFCCGLREASAAWEPACSGRETGVKRALTFWETQETLAYFQVLG